MILPALKPKVPFTGASHKYSVPPLDWLHWQLTVMLMWWSWLAGWTCRKLCRSTWPGNYPGLHYQCQHCQAGGDHYRATKGCYVCLRFVRYLRLMKLCHMLIAFLSVRAKIIFPAFLERFPQQMRQSIIQQCAEYFEQVLLTAVRDLIKRQPYTLFPILLW